MDGTVRAEAETTRVLPQLNPMERMVGGLVVLSRYLLVVFYLGLVAALAVYAFVFARHIWQLALRHEETTVLTALATMLQLIDAALVASLTIMVVFSNYENFVGRAISREAREVSWLGRLDPSSLKIKIATTIITISSIYMLKVFIDIEKHAPDQILWQLVICGFFLLAGVALVAIDRLAGSYAKRGVRDGVE
jgi:uncharacterized protein (TIGR00645 family)